MENASKALLIAGAILLCILIIAIGMFIYNSASATINNSMTSMSTQEIDAFNAQFTSYEGAQTGSQIKALMGRLLGNSDTYRDESSSVPQVYIDHLSKTNQADAHAIFLQDNEGDPQDYNDVISTIRNQVETKHTYWVEFSYQTNSLIDYIMISYDGTSDGSNGGHVTMQHR